MSYARVRNGTRGTLEFKQAQTDEDVREAVADVASQLGDRRPPLVHVRTQERNRELSGLVTAPRRARNDPGTDGWQQALANYVDEFESHIDEYQGEGYTFEDDIRDDEFSCILHSGEWTLTSGEPYQINFTAQMEVGRGTFELADAEPRNPTVQTDMQYAARVGGEPLPGFRQMRMSRSFDFESNAVVQGNTAETNQITPQSGMQQQITFEGQHTGSALERTEADNALNSLIDGGIVEFETRFPGYTLEGHVLNYESNNQRNFGTSMHQYQITFLESVVA